MRKLSSRRTNVEHRWLVYMSFVVLLSPEEIENFTQDHSVSSVEFEEQTPYSLLEEEYGVSVDRLKELIERLPSREADMLEMYYFEKKYQADIGRFFNVSQGDVSYRIRRAQKRLRFLSKYPEIDRDQMIADLGEILPKEDSNGTKLCGGDLYLRVMVRMYETSSQSVVADEMDIYQGRVRYRFLKGIKILEEAVKKDSKYDIYLKSFRMVAKNPNILRELKVQKRWQSKFQDVLV